MNPSVNTVMTIIIASLALLTACSKCDDTIATITVKGDSLSGIIEEGTAVNVQRNLACAAIDRNDIILYNYAGKSDPLIKIVKAIPGDTWRLDGCSIVVNDIVLSTRNPDGTIGAPYCVGDSRRLQLYANDYPIIPPDTYLIMGNNPDGTLDSSIFGLVDREDIIGKVEKG
ncbi:TPA: signal peptidase I [Candidatus Woesearchaeota archaeon]|nr:signal peptidase I [Candidatus Woesearchaeota archaeon]